MVNALTSSRLFLLVWSGWLLFSQAVSAATPYTGFYNGTVYIAISGNVSSPEHSAGAVGFTIREDGSITSSANLSGTVDADGNIAWVTPNSLYFTTGKVENGVVSATGSNTFNGTTTTFRVSASNTAPGFAGTSPLAGRIEQENPKQATVNLTRIRYANGRFMGVGPEGTVAFSDDGLIWKRFGLATTLALYDIAYGNGVYVAVGEAGVAYTSPDGVTWTTRSAGVYAFTGVAFGNGKFMRVVFPGTYSVSSDGITWQNATVTPPTSAGYFGLDFVNGNFALYSGSIVLTPDGATTAASGSSPVSGIVPSQSTGAKIVYGNGFYVVGGSAGVAYSADGNTWTKATGPASRIDAIGFGNGLFVIMDSSKIIWTSPDGANWLQAQLLQTSMNSIAYGNGRYIGAGQNLFASINGKLWVQPDDDAVQPDVTAIYYEVVKGIPNTVYYDASFTGLKPDYEPSQVGSIRGIFMPKNTSIGRLWFGDGGYIYYYAGQTNFITNAIGIASQLTDKTLRAAADVDDSAVILGGDAGTMIFVNRTNSLKGPAFSLLPAVTSADLLSGAEHVFVGSGGTILHAPNPKTWSAMNSGTTATLRHVYRYTSDEGISLGQFYVAVGDNGTIVTSLDGIAWTVQQSGTTARLIGSGYSTTLTPGRYLAFGEDGTVVQSTNAIAWTPHDSAPVAHRLTYMQNWGRKIIGGGIEGEIVQEVGAQTNPVVRSIFSQSYETTRNLNSGAFGNGRFVMVGGQTAGVSTDGKNWTFRGQRDGFVDVAYGLGKFVAVSPTGTIGVSTDGLNWNLKQVAATSIQFTTVTFGNGVFVAMGGGPILTSSDGENWTTQSTTAGANMTSVTFGNGKFVSVGQNGVAAYSTNNGVTWIASNTGAQIQQSVTFGNNRFASVGSDGRTAYSDNGINWASQRLSGASPSEGRPFFMRALYYDGGYYAITLGGNLYQSSNAIDWSIAQTGISIDLNAMTAANGVMLVAGLRQIHLITMANSTGPSIVSAPADQNTAQGSTVTLNATISGTNLVFSWSKDGVPVVDGGRISGSTTAILTITGATPDDNGLYALTASNSNGSQTTRPAIVQITAGASGFDAWSASHLPEGARGLLDDPDHDGISNIAEYAFGLNPTSAGSGLPQATSVSISGQDYAVIQFTRYTTASGVTIHIDASNTVDFGAALPMTESSESIGNGIERVTVRASQSLSGSGAVFFKVSIVQN